MILLPPITHSWLKTYSYKFFPKYTSFEHVIKIFLQICHSNLKNPICICRIFCFLPMKREEVSPYVSIKVKAIPVCTQGAFHHWSPLSTVSATCSSGLDHISQNINTVDSTVFVNTPSLDPALLWHQPDISTLLRHSTSSKSDQPKSTLHHLSPSFTKQPESSCPNYKSNHTTYHSCCS